jgi:hypothetical protein
VRCLADEALALIQPLFEATFKSPVSLDLLRWKYAQGRGASWTIWQDDFLLMHCGLCFRDILLQGYKTQAAQLVDLMAAPKQAGLSRDVSPFNVLMRHILASLPSAENPHGIAFGFPSGRAMRLGEHAGVYCSVDEWMSLEFAPAQMTIGPRVREIKSWGGAEVAVLNALWTRMRGSLAAYVVGIRDAEHVRQRYLRHPDKKYLLMRVESRWRRVPIGLLVIAPGPGTHELIDVVCSIDDFAEVILAARRWLGQTHGKKMTLLLTAHFAMEFAALATQCNTTQFRIMANPQTSAATLDQLKQRWWLTGGDTDYR